MSLAKGFESGFNMALSLGKFRLQEKEEERKSDLFELQTKEADLKIKKGEVDLQKSEIELEYAPIKNNLQIQQYESQIQSADALTTYRAGLTTGIINENIAEEKIRNYKAFSGIMSDMINLPSDDPLAREEFVMNNIHAAEKLQREGFDFVSTLSPLTAEAFNNINPILQSGNFEELGEYAKDLTQIYKGDLMSFMGKTFVDTSGREGIIKNVSFNGDIVGTDQGMNAVLGASYTVDFDGEEEVLDGFLPDNKQGKIRQDIEGVNAKAVSIIEATDKMSSLRSLLTLGMENPELFKTAQLFSDRMITDLVDPGGEKEKIDKVSARAIYTSAQKNFTDGKTEVMEQSGISLDLPLSGQEEEVSSAIQIMAFYMPQLSTEQNEDGLFVIPKKYDGNIGKYFASVQPDYDDALSIVSKKPNFATDKLKPGQQRVYSFGNKSFTYDSTRDEYLPELEALYGTEEIKRILDSMGGATSLTDDELLDLFYTEFVTKAKR